MKNLLIGKMYAFALVNAWDEISPREWEAWVGGIFVPPEDEIEAGYLLRQVQAAYRRAVAGKYAHLRPIERINGAIVNRPSMY